MKILRIEAKNRQGYTNSEEFEYPETLQEAIQMFGERAVFVGFLKTKIIDDQREVRPAKTKVYKARTRLSALERVRRGKVAEETVAETLEVETPVTAEDVLAEVNAAE